MPTVSSPFTQGSLSRQVYPVRKQGNLVLKAKTVTASGFLDTYVKLLPAHLSAVEQICAWIARDLGLPAPEPILVNVHRSVLPKEVKWPFENDSSHQCFATKEIPNGFPIQTLELSGRIINTVIAKWPYLAEVAIFDHLIANDDRSKSNILIDSSRVLWIIDHERALGGGGQAPFSDPFPLFTNGLMTLLAQLSLHERIKLRPKLIEICARCMISVKHIPYDDFNIEENMRDDIKRFLTARAEKLAPLVLQNLGISEIPGLSDGSAIIRIQ